MFRKQRHQALDFSMENRGDMLFAAGLVAIIALALGLTIYMTFFNQPGSDSSDAERHFQCMRCNKEFTLSNEQLQALMDEHPNQYDFEGAPIECQVCNAPDAAVSMTRCPACEKYYVSEEMKLEYQYGQGAGLSRLPEGYRPTCPHCNVDIIKARREKALDR
ncbi:MAG: hypothetical protein ACLFUJ_04825 [Phycisphaerae bacterium]